MLRLLHKEDILLETVDGVADSYKQKMKSDIDVLTKVWHQKAMVESEEQSGIVEEIMLICGSFRLGMPRKSACQHMGQHDKCRI